MRRSGDFNITIKILISDSKNKKFGKFLKFLIVVAAIAALLVVFFVRPEIFVDLVCTLINAYFG